eukprot:scaffold3226_cov251-Pinguiococcus_pyrenoidosus.AAC.1
MVAMHERQRQEPHLGDIGDVRLREVHLRSQHVGEASALHELHDDPHVLVRAVGLDEVHHVGVLRERLHPDLVQEIIQLGDGRGLQRHRVPRLHGARAVHRAAGPLAQPLQVGVLLQRIALAELDRGLEVPLERGATGHLGRRAADVEGQHVQHLIRVLRHLLLGDAGGLEHGAPRRRQALEARGRARVHVHMLHVLEVEGRRDLHVHVRAGGAGAGGAAVLAEQAAHLGHE